MTLVAVRRYITGHTGTRLNGTGESIDITDQNVNIDVAGATLLVQHCWCIVHVQGVRNRS